MTRVGIFGLTGCAGDQLAIINCEDELLKIAQVLDIKSFVMATSAGADYDGEFDLAIVEGSVCQPQDKKELEDIRARSKALMALGTCACFGGLPAMDNHQEAHLLSEAVYGREGARHIAVQRAQPLSAYVKVDFELAGCPVEKTQVLEAISCLLKGEFPELPPVPVCAECRLKENICVVIERGDVCCGSLTRSGCGARCPSLGVACRGCHGPLSDAYLGPREIFVRTAGITRDDIRQRILAFSTPMALEAKLDKEREKV